MKLHRLSQMPFSAAGAKAAWLPVHAGRIRTMAPARTMARVSAQARLIAVCDRTKQKCSLLAATIPSRASSTTARALSPQQVECPSTVAAGDGSGKSNGDMDKHYSPAEVEERLYTWWEQSGFFKPSEATDKQCFVLSMPPPNVTGKLHMGHAMFVAIEDIMARFHRMRGHPTLWLPGTDHAGIATQMLVENALREQGIERSTLGREAFLERVWEWKRKYGGEIAQQIRRLGASCDWSRERFTMEPDFCDAVNEAFVKLHERGLVYRGEYIVNWSPSLGTAVSDLEVDYVEEEGKLYFFKYPLADDPTQFIPVATTRPETILGDSAVCVHPDDERYAHMIGRELEVPLIGRRIRVVADDYVQMDFGTGALKVTPAHDMNDYAIGKRHALPVINILNKDATINDVGGVYAGLDRFDARALLWKDIAAAGLAIKVEKHTQRVPRSQRGGEVIEPLVSTQWFVKTDGMASTAIDAVRDGAIKVLPQRFEKVYFNWLDNIQDWCISRQLWWGHRIPVWYVDGTDRYFVGRSEAEAREKAAAEFGAGVRLTQDEDVLDTWFSSALWPFATVGWPRQSSDFERFYPSSVLETGHDIIFFWVARMVMLGIELTGTPPFHTIYLHGLVRDAHGQKMSKTKGNVVNPIQTIDSIGTDALRFALVTGATPGQDIALSEERLQAARNFANKLWNTCRFLTKGLQELSVAERQALAVMAPMHGTELASLPLPERWIISRCHALVHNVTDQLAVNDFGPAGQAMYAFLWDEYADWYIEISKPRISSGDPQASKTARRTLVYVLDTCLRLLHPYMPFITEEMWQRLPHAGETIMLAPWPQLGDDRLPRDAAAEKEFRSVQALVRAVRNARAEYAVQPAQKVAMSVVAPTALAVTLQTEAEVIAMLARVHPGSFGVFSREGIVKPEAAGSVKLVVEEGLEAYLPLDQLVDIDKERARLGKQAAVLETSIVKLKARLSSVGFTRKAPAAVVSQANVDLSEQLEQLAAVQRSLAELPTS